MQPGWAGGKNVLATRPGMLHWTLVFAPMSLAETDFLSIFNNLYTDWYRNVNMPICGDITPENEFG